MISLQITEADLTDVLATLGYEVSIRSDYSGRGMYGATCFGVVIDGPALAVGAAIAFALAGMWDELDFDPVEVMGELSSAAREDDMGQSTIVYFPGYQLAD